MRKLFKILMLVYTIFVWINTANAINVNPVSSPTNSCWWANVNDVIYLDENTSSHFLWDMFWSKEQVLISTHSTSVSIWQSDNNLLSGCTNNSDWTRISSLSPWDNQKVLAIWSNCTFNRPTDNNNRTLQFVYNIGYYDIVSGKGQLVWNYNLRYFLNSSEANNNTPHVKPFVNVWFENQKIHENECYNVELRYCWDNIVSNWETCDDWNNVDWDWCSATCTIIEDSCESWGVTWRQTSHIGATTPNLCVDWVEMTNFLATLSWRTTSYSWECGWLSGGNCNASYSRGWWSDPCITWWVTWAQTSPVTETTVNLCREWSTVSDFSSSVSWSTTYYNWSCDWDSGWSCMASYRSGWDGDWDWDWDGDWDGDTDSYCWNWKVERPSAEEIVTERTCVTGYQNNGNAIYWTCTDTEIKYVMEECDFWNVADWGFCNRDCSYWNFTIPTSWTWEITIPRGGKIVFWPSDSVIIWTWMNPYITNSLRPYIRNESDFDLYFDQLCVVERSWTTLLWSTVCEDTWTVLKAWATIFLSHTPNFVWAKIISWDYWDNRLVTTVRHKNVTYWDAYFASILNVRVAKSSVATTGWWTSYVQDTSTVWNISNIWNNWNWDPEKNKNFVWVWVSTWSLSSYSKDVVDEDSVDKVSKEWDIYSDSLDQVSLEEWTALWSTSLLSEFDNYHGHDNVFILKNKNFIVDSNVLSWLSWARTYIIENWDLEINYDIMYSDNIAFVVKWWNIKINKSVWEINWTYISILKGDDWWKFMWTWWNTTDILVVNGSLYWNINRLIASRTYVKQNASNQIDVWTIVSFGSSLFRETAPLVSTFINEYLKSKKVAY